MTVNMVTLIIAFNDVSSQDEKFQIEKVDRFYVDAINLAENEIDISFIYENPVPAKIAKLEAL